MGSVDRFNRHINYLRVAITDRCDLRCFYCMPHKGVAQYAHSEILTYEEMLRIVRTAAEIGFIGATSRHFRHSRNRLRLTPDGTLRPCLMSDEEIDIKTPLRKGCTAQDLEALFHHAIALKPRHPPIPLHNDMGSGRMMSRVGG